MAGNWNARHRTEHRDSHGSYHRHPGNYHADRIFSAPGANLEPMILKFLERTGEAEGQEEGRTKGRGFTFTKKAALSAASSG